MLQDAEKKRLYSTSFVKLVVQKIREKSRVKGDCKVVAVVVGGARV